jgi:hypothetical protein
MVHIEAIPEASRDKYPDYDRLMVFDDKNELLLIKAAVVARMARRIIEGLQDVPLDRAFMMMPDHIPACVAHVEMVNELKILLEQAAEDDLGDPELPVERREKMREIAGEVVLTSQVFDETKELDFDSFWNG